MSQLETAATTPAAQGAELSIPQLIADMGRRARAAAALLTAAAPAAKNEALERAATLFEARREDIRRENAKDLASGRQRGLSDAMLDRLELTDARIQAMATALREVAALPDPVGELSHVRVRPNGLRLGKMRAPIGVVGIIYESRPNVTADAGALCLKSGNAVILRGGSEALHSNKVLAALMAEATGAAGLPQDAIQLVPTTDRAAVGELLRADKFVDIIIPRGGKSLIQRIMDESRIPVIKHLDGNCSVYVDEFADLAMAETILVNSKTHRYGVCNAAETLLVHEAVAGDFLPRAVAALAAKGVEIRGCARTRAIVPQGVVEATEEDWGEEYLAPIIAARIVDSFDDAVAFINHYGSHHTDVIVSKDYGRITAFTRRIDSACVHVNCSSRFSDGGEYGLGAEIGISTDKLHARGPMGLEELTTSKWVALGEGQIR
ncbi:MAG: glutamate-5-semialdehyde dehydrogenase [Sumerlaeia bacterium]